MALETIVSDVYLDVYDHDTTPTTIKTIALDSHTRIVRAYLQKRRDEIYQPDLTATVELIAIRPDKVGVISEGEVVQLVPETEEDAAIYGVQAVITQAMIAISGKVRFQFKLTVGEEIIRTEIFVANNGEALDGDTADWADEYQGYNLDELAEKVEFAVRALEDQTQGDSTQAMLSTHLYIDKRISIRNNAIHIDYPGDEPFEGEEWIEPYFAETIGAATNEWLDEHPEATTTVVDGSLTEAKFTDALKLKTIKEYVTPEMFGAIGDGVADDTEAIQAAIDAGKYVFCTKKYKTTDEIYINKHGIYFDAGSAEFTYEGNDSAFVIQHVNGGYISINKITSAGNCIEFRSSVGSADDSQYVYLYFNLLSADETSGSCILINTSGDGWSNQNYVYGGQLLKGAYGVRSISDKINMWHFENVGVEGVQSGFDFNIPSGSKYTRITWTNLRYEENISTPLITITGGGIFEQCEFHGTYDFDIENRLVYSGVTLRSFLIDAPILRPSQGNTIYSYGAWFTSSGRFYLWKYDIDDKSVVEKVRPKVSGTITASSMLDSGSIKYYKNGVSITIVFDNMVFNYSSGSLVADMPEGIIPSYDVPFLLFDTNSDVIARGYVNKVNSVNPINVGGIDTTKTYRGTITYTLY